MVTNYLCPYLFSTPLSSLFGQIILGLVVDFSLLPRCRDMRHIFLKNCETYFTYSRPVVPFVKYKDSKVILHIPEHIQRFRSPGRWKVRYRYTSWRPDWGQLVLKAPKNLTFRAPLTSELAALVEKQQLITPARERLFWKFPTTSHEWIRYME